MSPYFVADWNFWLTFSIALATVANVWVAKMQWKAASDSVKLTRESINLATKPCLAVTATNIESVDGRDCWDILVKFENYGAMVATGIDEDARLFVGGEEVSTTRQKSKHYTLPPRIERTIILTLEDISAMEAIKSKERSLEVITRLHYKDIGGKRYKTYEKDSFDVDLNRFLVVESSVDEI
jgi:hypothetical protein